MKTAHYLIAATALCLGFTSMAARGVDVMQDKNKHVAITPQEFTWVDGPDALPETKMVILEGDPSKAGPLTLRIKAPAHYKIQAHWHPAIEHVTVLQGTLYMGDGNKLDESKGKELPVGSFVAIPKKAHHYAWTGNEETIIQLHGIGPWGITYLNPTDDPRKNKNKNK